MVSVLNFFNAITINKIIKIIMVNIKQFITSKRSLYQTVGTQTGDSIIL